MRFRRATIRRHRSKSRGAFAPRSPRLALEPERVPGPTRRSKRVRHPIVIAGNAVFTFLVLVILAVGGALFFGQSAV